MAGFQFVQYGFRLRNDNGSQSTATWIGNQNANATIVVDTNFRIRFSLTTVLQTGAISLFWSKNSGTYTALNAVNASVISHASTYVSDNTTCTNQMTNAQAFAVGGVVDTNNNNGVVNHQTTSSYEYEWCLQIVGAQVTHGDIINFKMYGSSSAFGGSTPYPQIPAITVNKPAYVIVPPVISINLPSANMPIHVPHTNEITNAFYKMQGTHTPLLRDMGA